MLVGTVLGCVLAMLAIVFFMLRPAIEHRLAARRSRAVPAPPEALYRWLAEVRQAAQEEHGLPHLEFEQPTGTELQRFLLAWNGSTLQLHISSPRCRYRFACSVPPARTWFEVAPPADDGDVPALTDERFWQLGIDSHSWRAVVSPEQHAHGLMLAKLFFASWQNHAGPADGGRQSAS